MTGPEIAVAGLVVSLLGAASSAAGQIQQGQQAKSAAEFQAGIARNNAIIAQQKADDARARGEIAAATQARKTKQLIGQQEVALAASGVLTKRDSPLDLIVDTAGLGELDALTIQSNAEREALGFEAQGRDFTGQAGGLEVAGANAVTGSFVKAGSTLLTGTGTVASKWAAFNKGSTPFGVEHAFSSSSAFDVNADFAFGTPLDVAI